MQRRIEGSGAVSYRSDTFVTRGEWRDQGRATSLNDSGEGRDQRGVARVSGEWEETSGGGGGRGAEDGAWAGWGGRGKKRGAGGECEGRKRSPAQKWGDMAPPLLIPHSVSRVSLPQTRLSLLASPHSPLPLPAPPGS